MKYLKKLEHYYFNDRFKVGDFVIIINPYISSNNNYCHPYSRNFKLGDRCKIISIVEDDPYITIQNEINGSITTYRYTRIIPEEQYYAKKFNI